MYRDLTNNVQSHEAACTHSRDKAIHRKGGYRRKGEDQVVDQSKTNTGLLVRCNGPRELR